MDPNAQVPVCPVPSENVSDVIPMLIVIGLFLAAGWLYRRWRKS
jgi:hypothetical protein